MDQVVVVGASLAGVRAAEALRREGFRGELTVIGAEQHFPPYDRPPLSKEVLAGLWEPDRGRLKVSDSLDAHLLLGRRAVAVDLDKNNVDLDDGTAVGFDGLVVATGATPKMLASIDATLPGVFVLRTHEDCLALREALVREPKVAIVGAGWIGCEVAATCRARGLQVSVVEFAEWPMERTLGAAMGSWAAGLHESHGVDLRLGVGVTAVSGRGRVEEVHLADGTTVAADVVIVAIGVAPETGWLASSGLDIDNGVLLDASCRAIGAENVVAAGDVARWYNETFEADMRIEHWSNAVEQAGAAAQTLLRTPEESLAYATVPYVWSDQYDKKLQYAGIPGEFHGVVEGSPEDGKFVAAFSSDGRLVGALCVNSPARMVRYKRLIASRPPIENLAELLS